MAELLDSGSENGIQLPSTPQSSGSGGWPGMPTVPQDNKWMQILQLLAMGGKGAGTANLPFGGSGPQLTPQQGVPMYYMPQATPLIQDEQKQSSVGEVNQYAKMLSALFA